MSAESASVLFDLNVLVDRDGRRTRDAERWLALASRYRLGVVAELRPGAGYVELRRILADAVLDGWIEPDLALLVSALPIPSSDPRPYAAAAALTGSRPDRCLLVSANANVLKVAAAAGLRVLRPADAAADINAAAAAAFAGAAPLPKPALSADDGDIPRARLLAGEIDEDVGPTFILRGRVVTMDATHRVIDDGRVVVSRGKIVQVLAANEPVAADYMNALVVSTDGSIYPGLIDLHNHLAYNVIPLWPIEREFPNRGVWARLPRYKAEISTPLRTLAAFAESSRALIRFVEAKALIGGTTTGQGIRTRVSGTKSLFRGAMRNVEETDDYRLPPAGSQVPDLQVKKTEEFRRTVTRRSQSGGAFFYHMSEGTDAVSARVFEPIVKENLIVEGLVGIHALGVNAPGLKAMAQGKAKLVWSPFSNLLLYKKTLSLETLIESGITFSLGSDWSPTGSKNLLQELKVARWENGRQNSPLTSRALVAAVTSEAAKVVRWEAFLGQIAVGKFADLLLIDGNGGDPYDHLIDATEGEVRLVTVHGQARYGEETIVRSLLAPGRTAEHWRLDGREMAFDIAASGSGIEDLTFADAVAFLKEAMSDLPDFEKRMKERKARLQAFGVDLPEELTLELDNELDELEDAGPQPALLAPLPPVKTIPLDIPYVGEATYWERLGKQKNVDPELITTLRRAYGA